jgi:hypothetical protein
MPITPFLSGQSFDPETVAVMGAAFTEACKTLGLTDRDDQMTRLVAKHIIGLALGGIRTKTTLYMRTIQEFKADPH